MRSRGIIATGLALVTVFALAAPAGAQTAKAPCQSFILVVGCNPIVSGVLNTLGGAVSANPALTVEGGIQIGSGAAQVGRSAVANWMKGALGNVASAIGDALSRAASSITHEIDGATIPKNFPSWFLDSWGLTKNLAFQILFLCYIIAIIAGVIKANIARVAQTPLLAAAAIGGMAITLAVVSVAVQSVDWASAQIMHGASANIDTVMHTFGNVILLSSLTGVGSNLVLTLGVLLLILVAFAIVWFNLLVRKWIIYIATGMFALALSGSLTKAGAKWLKFLAVLLGTVILSKLLLVVILSYGVSALAQPSGISDVAGGGSVFLLSGLAPWVLVGIIFGGAMHALHGGANAAGQPARMGRDAMKSVRRTHNHWQTWRRSSSSSASSKTGTASKAPGAKTGARGVAGARGAGAATGAAAGVATAGAAVAVGAAKKAATAVKRAPAKLTGPPPPQGASQTKSGLLVPKAGGSIADLKTAAGPRPAGLHRPMPSPRSKP